MADEMTTIKVTCTVHGGDVEVRVRKSQLKQWLQRPAEHIQYVFPDLSPAERELFISGCCGDCWNKMFPPDADGY